MLYLYTVTRLVFFLKNVFAPFHSRLNLFSAYIYYYKMIAWMVILVEKRHVLVFVRISIGWLVRRFAAVSLHNLASSSARLGLLLGQENDRLL